MTRFWFGAAAVAFVLATSCGERLEDILPRYAPEPPDVGAPAFAAAEAACEALEAAIDGSNGGAGGSAGHVAGGPAQGRVRIDAQD